VDITTRRAPRGSGTPLSVDAAEMMLDRLRAEEQGRGDLLVGPNVPMYVVREGDIVIMRIENHSGRVHPMHLHATMPSCWPATG
jgi:FtsP/CotA-like multicopper oxidase with cupredoxin domain